MKLWKRILAAMLCATVTLPLFGCDAETTNEESIETTDTVKTETEYVMWQNLPKEDLGGYDFQIIEYESRADAGVTIPHGNVEELTGEAINDAIYKRNRAVEDTFGCVITTEVVGWGQAVETLSQCVTAGDDVYAMAMDVPVDTTLYVLQNVMLNLWDLKYLNLENPWYNQKQVKDFTIQDKLFYVLGDVVYSTLMFGTCLVYNLDMSNEYGLPYIYDTIMENQWTLDRMYEITGGVTEDLNGDGFFRADDDQFGYVIENASNLMNYMFTCECNFISYDGNTKSFVDTFNVEKVSSIVEMVNKLYYDDNRGAYGDYTAIFNEGRALIRSAYVGGIIDHQEMEDAFTPIPYPKYDENQADYLSMMTGSVQVVSVPTTVQDRDAVGLIIEAMSEYSHGELKDAVYEQVLAYQTMRTEDARDILQMIHDSLIIDFGYMTAYGDANAMKWVVGNLVSQKSTDVASYYARYKNALRSFYDELNETYATLGN